MLRKFLVAASISLAASLSFAQAKIIDSQPMSGRGPSSVYSEGQSSSSVKADRSLQSSPQSEMYYQLQLLQEEVQQLRGLVEEQSYELKRLKQQRLEDYLDLDRRISHKGSSGSSGVSSRGSDVSSASANSLVDNSSDESGFQKGEFASYQAAIGLALKKRDFEGAIAALEAHLKNYPSGSYVANAQYWLGQIYLQKGDLELSRRWFSEMTENYPNHQKAPEAKFKLGKVLHQLGETLKAKALLQEVADTGNSASGLAKDYLKQNF